MLYHGPPGSSHFHVVLLVEKWICIYNLYMIISIKNYYLSFGLGFGYSVLFIYFFFFKFSKSYGISTWWCMHMNNQSEWSPCFWPSWPLKLFLQGNPCIQLVWNETKNDKFVSHNGRTSKNHASYFSVPYSSLWMLQNITFGGGWKGWRIRVLCMDYKKKGFNCENFNSDLWNLCNCVFVTLKDW